MHDAASELEKEIHSFHDGIATLDQVRDLAAHIGDQHCLSAASVLMELLVHEDEIVRYHAAMSLGFKLKFKAATNPLTNMLREDPDEDCRDAAAGALGVMWRNSKDRQIIEQLSKVALLDSDEDVQKAAYFALLIVNGVSDKEYLNMLQHDRPSVDPDRVTAIRAGIAS